MEFALNNKNLQYQQPIHTNNRKQVSHLFPNTKPKKHKDSRFRLDSPRKTSDLQRISTIDSEELQNYMNCGGIKLNNRFNKSMERGFKKENRVAAQTDGLPRLKSFISPSTPLKRLHISQHQMLGRRSNIQDNPQSQYLPAPIKDELKIISQQEIIISKNMNKKNTQENCNYGFYCTKNCYVSLYPCDEKIKIISHQNILPTFGLCIIQEKVYYMTDMCQGLSLRNLLIQFGKMNQSLVKLYIRQLVSGVQAIHRQGFKHNRLNLDNVLHDKMGNILINSFTGSSRLPSQKDKNLQAYYYPPETLLAKQHILQSRNDIWAIGCITLQLLEDKSIKLSNYHPYNFVTQSQVDTEDFMTKVRRLICSETLQQSYRQKNEQKSQLSLAALQFIRKCLSLRYDQYPTASELLQSPFLTQ